MNKVKQDKEFNLFFFNIKPSNPLQWISKNIFVFLSFLDIKSRDSQKERQNEMATVGGIKEVEGSANSLEIDSLARFAVDDYNKKHVLSWNSKI